MTGQIRSHSKILWVAAGTGAAVLGAAIIFQCFRASPGTAAEEQGTRASAKDGTSGKVSLNKTGTPSAASPAAQKNNFAARISLDGKVLTISDDEVAKECVARLGKEVLDNMINRATIQLACQARGIEVTSAEVNKEIVRIAAEFKIPTEQYLQMLQAERNINPTQYQRDVIWPMLALRKLAGTEIQVTKAEVDKAFQREYGPRVKVRMILCDNLRRAQAAWQKAKEDPENFEKYVQEFSIDQSSKSLDGSVPPIPRHSGSPNIETAAFKLKPGEVSAVVQLDDAAQRYVILKCEGRTKPVVEELDQEIQAELEDQIKRQKTQEQVAIVFDNLKKETQVHNYYTGEATGGSKPTNVARPDGTKPTGTRPASKINSASDNANPIRQASAKGPANNKSVKPATATSNDNDEIGQPATRTTPKRSTATSQ
ncbi:MAG: peptidylprolyl isomerase [Planctomycetes bacterium]|nr:peptidylprolyl isomerase [Planctomycetota bacterium]